MTEQHEGEHEWVPRILDWEDVDGARCILPFCDAQMDDEEMSRRLNATMRLSANAAIEIAMGIEETGGILAQYSTDAPMLRSYADILEGK